MADEKEYDEDGFPIYRPSPEEMAATKARMETLVDCRKLAVDRVARLAPPDPELTAWLRDEHGVDGARTLTEIENEDWGDAYDQADEPEVHALRYVPVAQWPVSDIALMLMYGHGVKIAVALADWYLSRDPMLEGHSDAWNLIELFSREACALGRQDKVRDIAASFQAKIWVKFDRAAAGLDEGEVKKHRTGLQNGQRAPAGQNPFLGVERDLQTLARLKNDTDPLEVLCHAETKQLFAKYRPRKSVELVLVPDRDVPDYRAVLHDPSTFQFRRDTRFTIVRETGRNGVRLRIFAQSAVDHLYGIWFPDADAAKAAALRDFGIGVADWVDWGA